MHMLNEGRKAYLDFLSNLTPQILLFSIAFVIGSRLNFKQFDLSNTPLTLLFFLLLFLAILGMVANSLHFLDEYCQSISDLEQGVKKRIGDTSPGTGKRFTTVISEAWKLRKSLGVELIFSIAAVFVAMIGVLIWALLDSTDLLQKLD